MKNDDNERIIIMEKLKARLENKKLELEKKLENIQRLKEYAASEKELGMEKQHEWDKIDSQIKQLYNRYFILIFISLLGDWKEYKKKHFVRIDLLNLQN